MRCDHMRRKLLAFVCSLSLLLCVATIVLWARSYSVGCGIFFCSSTQHDYCQYGVASERGSLRISRYFASAELSASASSWHYTRWTPRRENRRVSASWYGIGFGYLPIFGTGTSGGGSLTVADRSGLVRGRDTADASDTVPPPLFTKPLQATPAPVSRLRLRPPRHA